MKLQIKAGPINFVQVAQIAHLFDDALWSRDLELGDKFVVEFEVEQSQFGALAELARILDWVEGDVDGADYDAALKAYDAAVETYNAAVETYNAAYAADALGALDAARAAR